MGGEMGEEGPTGSGSDSGSGSGDDGTFRCHPECLKRSYWRKLFLEVEEEIRGLRPGQFVELVLAVEKAEVQALAESDERSWWDRPNTPVGRAAAVELFIRGWSEAQIDMAFGFPHGTTDRIIGNSRIHPRSREIVAAHLLGDSPSRISRDHNVGIPTVCEILRGIGEEPHTIRNLAKSADTNRAVKRRYEEGWSYRQIADHLDITEQAVRQRLQYMRRKGRIDQPPRGESGGGRRRAAE